MSAILSVLPRSAFTSARRSIDMGWQNLAQRKPPGASCNWVKEELSRGAPYMWWRPTALQGCSVQNLRIQQSPWYLTVAPPSGAWWTGEVGAIYPTTGCASASGYVVNVFPGAIDIDVWGALKFGVWSSSVSFQVRCSGPNGASCILSAGGVGSAWRQEQPFTALTASSCSSGGVLKTVTVYDDGRITIT
jgi:hypothetical protein